MDKNGFSDPYVKFHLLPGNTKATKLTSRTIEKTLNPEWNEVVNGWGGSQNAKKNGQNIHSGDDLLRNHGGGTPQKGRRDYTEGTID